jgi:hypothetical protein
MGSRLKSLESEMQQVEGEYQSAWCPSIFGLRTLPNCMPPRMTGDSCRPRASNRTLVGKLPPSRLAKRTEAATEFQVGDQRQGSEAEVDRTPEGTTAGARSAEREKLA